MGRTASGFPLGRGVCRAVLLAVGGLALALLLLVGCSKPVAAGTNIGAQTIQADTHWTTDGSPYTIMGHVSVTGTNAPVLTIDPGVTVQFNQGADLQIGGSQTGVLNAVGTAASPILFTSAAATKAPGTFFLKFQSINTAYPSRFENATVEYGGLNGNGNVWVTANLVTIRNVTSTKSSNYAFRFDNSITPILRNVVGSDSQYGFYANPASVTLIDSVASGNTVYGFYSTTSSSIPTLSNVSFQGNNVPLRVRADTSLASVKVQGDTTKQVEYYGTALITDRTWPVMKDQVSGETYATALISNVVVWQGATLTLPPGTIIKGAPGVWLHIGDWGGSTTNVGGRGSLIAAGTAAQPILMTSLQSTQANWWQGLVLYAGSSAGTAIVRNVTVENARGDADCTSGLKCGALRVELYSNAVLDNVTIDHTVLHGMTLYSASPTVRNLKVISALGSAVVLANSDEGTCAGRGPSNPTFYGLEITSGGVGIDYQNGAACNGSCITYSGSFTDTVIRQTTGHGVKLATSCDTLNPTFTRLTIDHVGGHAVYMSDCGAGAIKDSVFDTPTGYGIFTTGDCAGMNLDNVQILAAGQRAVRNRVDLRNTFTFTTPGILDMEYWGGTGTVLSDYTIPLYFTPDGTKYTTTFLTTVLFDHGMTLTIPAGSVIRLENGAVFHVGSWVGSTNNVNGKANLVALGTTSDPILVTSNKSASASWFQGVTLYGGSFQGSYVVRNLTVQNAKGNADCASGLLCGALRVEVLSSAILDNVTIDHATGAGLTVYSATPTIRNLKVLATGGSAVVVANSDDGTCAGRGPSNLVANGVSVVGAPIGIDYQNGAGCNGSCITYGGTWNDVDLRQITTYGVKIGTSCDTVSPTFTRLNVDHAGSHAFYMVDCGAGILKDTTLDTPTGYGVYTNSDCAGMNLDNVNIISPGQRAIRNRVDLRNTFAFSDPGILDMEYWGGTGTIVSDYTVPLYFAPNGTKYTTSFLTTVIVDHGATLTIPAGSVLRFDNNAVLMVGSWVGSTNNVNGKGNLVALGTSANRIVLTNLQPTSNLYWQGLYLYGGSSAGTFTLRNVTVQNAKGSNDCTSGLLCGAVRVEVLTAVTLDNVTVDHPTTLGLAIYSSSPTIRNLQVLSAGGNAIAVANSDEGNCAGRGTSNIVANGVTVTGAVIGIDYQNGAGCNGSCITYGGTWTDAVIRQTTSYGVRVSTSCDAVSPTFTRLTIDHPGNNGFQMTDCGAGVLKDSLIDTPTGYGVFTNSDCAGMNLDNVNIVSPTQRVLRNRLDLRNTFTFSNPGVLDMEYWGGSGPIVSDYTVPLYFAPDGTKYTTTFLSDVDVDHGATFTIPAGSVIRFESNKWIHVGTYQGSNNNVLGKGNLVAVGTATNPILLTSLQAPSSSWWQGVVLYGASSPGSYTLRNVTIQNARGNLDCSSGLQCGVLRIEVVPSAVIDNVTIDHTTSAGLTLYSASPTVRNLKVISAGGSAIVLANSDEGSCAGRGPSNPTLTGINITGAVVGIDYQNGAGCNGSCITYTGSWTDVDIRQATSYGVRLGTSCDTVSPTFTRVNVDRPGNTGFQMTDCGAGILKDSTITAPNGYGVFTNSDCAGINLDNVNIVSPTQRVLRNRLDVRNTITFSNPGILDMEYWGGSPLVTDTTIPLYFAPDGTKYTSTILTDVDVDHGATLTIPAGSVIRFDNNAWIHVGSWQGSGSTLGKGSLVAVGTNANPILLTSLQTPSASWWQGVVVYGASSPGTYTIRNVTLQNAKGNLDCSSGLLCGVLRAEVVPAATIDNVTIDHTTSAGFTVYSASPTVRNLKIISAGGNAVVLANSDEGSCAGRGGSSPTVNGLNITGALIGIDYQNGAACNGSCTTYAGTFNDVEIRQTTSYGIHVGTSCDTVNPSFNRLLIDHPGNHGVFMADAGTMTLTDASIVSPNGNGILASAAGARVNLVRATVTDAAQEAFLISAGAPSTVRSSTFKGSRNGKSGLRVAGTGTAAVDVRDSLFYDNLGYGVDLDGRSGATIINNAFAGNTLGNAHSTSATANTWNLATKSQVTNIGAGPFSGGNLWSDYQGVDQDGDGIGDTLRPYNVGIAAGGDSMPLVSNMFADMTWTYPQVATNPKVVALHGITSGGLSPAFSWDWDFGDGTPHVGTQDATHTYAADGQYAVRLVTVNSFGQRGDTTKFVQVDSNAPTSTATTAGTLGTNGWYKSGSTPSVTLAATDDRSGVAAIKYKLDNGAVTTYTSAIALAADGTHTVDYYSVDLNGNTETTKTVTVKVDRTAPTTPTVTKTGLFHADGSYDDDFNFTLASSDAQSGLASIKYATSKGTSGFPGLPSPTIVYTGPVPLNTQGYYSVQYTATDQAGNTATSSFQVRIAVSPIAKFTASTACGPHRSFDASTSLVGSAAIVDYAWDFGDGVTEHASVPTTSHDYASPGTRTVKLTVTDADGLSGTTSASLSVAYCAPTARFTVSPDCAAERTFTSTSTGGSTPIASYLWNFGDGATSTDGPVAAHTFATLSQFTVRLTVTAQDGSTGTTTVTTVKCAPTASFTTNAPCGLHADVDATSSKAGSAAIVGYAWTFGDAATGNSSKTGHDYASYGSYTVGLTVTAADGETGTTSRTVTLNECPPAEFPPIAAFSSTCSFDVAFDPTGSVGVTSPIKTSGGYSWTFGDATSSASQTPVHHYASQGKYNVTLTVTDTANRKGSVTHQISVPGACPRVDVGNARLNESDGNVNVTVSLTAPAAFTTSVHYATGDTTAVSGVSNCGIVALEADYEPTAGDLVFAPGTVQKNITIHVGDDGCVEPDETFSVVLSSPVSAVLGSSGIVTIANDDETGPAAALRMSPSSLDVIADDVEGVAFFYTLKAYDEDGNLVPLPATPTWTTNDTRGGVFAPNGTLTLTGRAGTYSVTATSGDLSDERSVLVEPGRLVGIRVVPEAAAPDPGGEVRFSAHGEDKHRNDLGPKQVQWSLTNASMGSIGGTGLFLSDGHAGQVAVRAYLGGIIGLGSVHVTTQEVAGNQSATVPASVERVQTGDIELVTVSVGVAKAGAGAQLNATINDTASNGLSGAAFRLEDDAKNFAVFVEAQNGSKNVLPPEIDRDNFAADIATYASNQTPALFLRLGASENSTILDSSGLNRFLDKVNLTFSVPRSLLNESAITNGSVRLLEYSEGSLINANITATLAGCSDTACNFTVEVNRFSTFAIIGSALSRPSVTGGGLPPDTVIGGIINGVPVENQVGGSGNGPPATSAAPPQGSTPPVEDPVPTVAPSDAPQGSDPPSPTGATDPAPVPSDAPSPTGVSTPPQRSHVYGVPVDDATVQSVDVGVAFEAEQSNVAEVTVFRPEALPAGVPEPPAKIEVQRYMEVVIPGVSSHDGAHVTFHVSLPASDVPDPQRGLLLHLIDGSWVPETRLSLVRNGDAYEAAAESSCCSVFAIAFDLQAPLLSVAWPADPSTSSVTLDTGATDNIGWLRVEAFVDGTSMANTSTRPYVLSVDVSALTSGDHDVRVVATDFVGNSAESVGTLRVAHDRAHILVDFGVPASTAAGLGALTPLLLFATVFAGGGALLYRATRPRRTRPVADEVVASPDLTPSDPSADTGIVTREAEGPASAPTPVAATSADASAPMPEAAPPQPEPVPQETSPATQENPDAK